MTLNDSLQWETAGDISSREIADGAIAAEDMQADELGCFEVALDHATAAGVALVTAPANVALVCCVYAECTENFAGATFVLGNGSDVDHFDDGTLHAAADADGENFTLWLKLEPGEVLTAKPSVAGTAGAYKYSVIAQRVTAS